MPGRADATAAPPLARRQARLRLLAERATEAMLLACAAVAVLATAAIFWTLLTNGRAFFDAVPLHEFFLGTSWAPDTNPRRFGMLPLLKGTVQVAVGAAAIGVPLGVGAAIYLSEFARPRVRAVLKPALELLAGIPSIVFGLVALFLLAPAVQEWFGAPPFTALAATIALGIMVVPIISSISEDAIRAVPRELREGAMALGSTRWETAWTVVVPAARSGITAAAILGFSRAIGETMVVTMAAGNRPTLDLSYLVETQTITAYMANRAGGDLSTGSVEYLSLFALGAVLFALTFAVNLVAQAALARQRRRFS